MRIHLIAIGGAVMHNLALELQHQGHQVSGSDDIIFEPAKSRLEQQGLLPEQLGWHEDSITKDIDLVILGMHAQADNPELLKAQHLGLKLVSFPSFVFQCSQHKKRLVVSGSHGKTTTTAMVMHCLRKQQIPFDYLVGSTLPGFDRMVSLSKADIIIIEGDEYLSSALDPRPKFFHYKAHASVITGMAWDHINVFPTYEHYVAQFNKYTNTLAEGALLYVHESVNSEPLFSSAIPFSTYTSIPYQVINGQSKVIEDGQEYLFPFFGRFNFENMEAARLLCAAVGVDRKTFLQSMTDYPGSGKRQEVLMSTANKTVLRDFAHSPSKVKAMTLALQQTFPESEWVCVLELHTYSSLLPSFIPQYQDCLNGFVHAALYIDENTLTIKGKELPDMDVLKKTFPGVQICTTPEALASFKTQKEMETAAESTVWLWMSSGQFGGISLL
jgi:UDP-N-acetylmuramate: L-alanyl-gamma-D-glutamyl-meso-diaminopimelate ligase